MSAGRRARWSALMARIAAPVFAPEEYAGQESPLAAAEVLELSMRAGIAAASRVADLCCGTAGPGVLLAVTTGCALTGLELDREAVGLAAGRAAGHGCSERMAFVLGDARRLPLAPVFDTVLLLETMLELEDKAALLRAVHGVLTPGGRFALTLEAGDPLSPGERRGLPGGDQVWFTPEPRFQELLAGAGFRVTWSRDLTAGHADRTRRLAIAFERDRPAIVDAMGEPFWTAIVAQHRTFATWLERGRLRKVAIVAERGG